jgi:hypothetical protein
MVRDVLALTPGGLPIDKLVEKLKSRVKHISHNEVMTLVLELNERGLVKYSQEVGTWQSTVRLV